jgi:hypothetical protein
MKEDINEHLVSYLQETNITDTEFHLTHKVVEQKYLKKRKNQLNVIIFSSLICSLSQIAFHYVEEVYLDDQFDYTNDKTVPITITSMLAYGIYMLCLLIPLYVNYFIFYFYVRKSFKHNDNRLSRLLSNDDIIKFSDVKPGKGIESFLE